MHSEDPTVIRSLAVHREDIVTALEANAGRGATAVLRVTPPFNGRMRARLHLAGGEGGYESAPAPIHIPPDRFVSDPAPAYPEPDETEDQLRTAGATAAETVDPEQHREVHTARVADWRTAVAEALLEQITIETPAGDHDVAVLPLG